MHITDFADLLRAARAQSEPQRLLLVFVRAELPEDADMASRKTIQRGGVGGRVANGVGFGGLHHGSQSRQAAACAV